MGAKLYLSQRVAVDHGQRGADGSVQLPACQGGLFVDLVLTSQNLTRVLVAVSRCLSARVRLLAACTAGQHRSLCAVQCASRITASWLTEARTCALAVVVCL